MRTRRTWRRELVEPPRAPDLAPQRERPPELDPEPETTPLRSSACAASCAGRGYVEPRVHSWKHSKKDSGSIHGTALARWRGEPSTSDGLSACCPLSPGRDG